LAESLERIFGSGTPPTTLAPTTTTTAPPETTTTTAAPTTTTTTGPTLPTDAAALIALAENLYEEALDAQRAGDWATYGELIDELGRVLERLAALSQ